jgi:ribonucleoside-diphosphate reductase alpha chain
LNSTTTGIEPLYAVAYKRRYLSNGTKWKYEYVVDATAQSIIEQNGVNPDDIETAASLAYDIERRIKFQYDVQRYVDMAISSTNNLPEWGTAANNEKTVELMTNLLAKYAHGLRGFTVYPDGSRGGQPLTCVPYKEAISKKGVVFDENENGSCKNGVCGI